MTLDLLPGGRTTLVSVLAVVVIAVLDATTTGGVVVGILLVVPIIAVSYTDRPRAVWLVFGLAWVGFMLAALLGRPPVTALPVALANRVFVLLTIGASAWAALQLQRRRVEAQHVRDAAIDTREVNRLLMSLIAHDLRSPLATALHALEFLEQPGASTDEDSADVAREVKGRLRRSLRVIDAFLAMGAADGTRPSAPGATLITGIQLGGILTEEVRAFVPEAEARSKRLLVDVSALPSHMFQLNVLILRQALAILLDNAVRYAVPGPIRVCASLTGPEISVLVEDSGPGLSTKRQGGEGAGLGLELCGALVRRSRGRLDVVRDSVGGTTFTLRLPVEPGGDPGPA